MGKFALCVAGWLLFSGTIEGKAVAADGRHSQVSASPQMAKKRIKRSKKSTRAKRNFQALSQKELVNLARELDQDLGDTNKKFLASSVRYAASSAPVPESYDCNTEQEEQKRLEAEADAMAKCEASGEKFCRVYRSSIVKRGALRCGDVPGRSCKKEHIRGCVARAVVVSGQAPEAQAGIF